MNPTNDPALKSFLDVPQDSHFPIQNLPYGIFSRRGSTEQHIGVAIGDSILDLRVLFEEGLLQHPCLCENSLNPLLSQGKNVWTQIRTTTSQLLRAETATLKDNASVREKALVPMTDTVMHLPVEIGDYTDFYSSKEHATNVGTMLRGPDNALMPNWVHLPVAYHGRASSVIPSGTPIYRPKGQKLPPTAEVPVFGPSRNLDFELEMGFFVGPGNVLSEPIAIGDAMNHIFGMVLVNDWSARDIQKWEYQPLGPFLAKSFATSVSPWVVPMEALEPFRVAGPKQAPQPLEYLRSSKDYSYDIHLEVWLKGEKMDAAERICLSNYKYLYWNCCQQLAHHTTNGCNLRPGDLLATGTISGPDSSSFGSMLELAWRGTKPIEFANGETRSFLEDNDTITMTGWCQGGGYRVGFGEVKSTILPSKV
ncbi:MAG: fumarylacetoacetase [Gemmataceae bacterium]